MRVKVDFSSSPPPAPTNLDPRQKEIQFFFKAGFLVVVVAHPTQVEGGLLEVDSPCTIAPPLLVQLHVGEWQAKLLVVLHLK